ncbi:MAG TPA: DUF1579 family protein [Terriglobales bacterium]|nr:DUF1579 family protein [Terriglobales bacterium]
MRRTTGATVFLGLTVFILASLNAQVGPPTPAPELKKLDFMAGDWTSEGTANPAPGMPGGKFTSSSHAEWMEGNFFLVEHGVYDMGQMGKVKELAILGYDSDRKVYTYHAFNSMGEAVASTGTVNGDTWTWLSDDSMGGKMMKGRFTMKVLSPTSYTMKFEMSQDGTNWTTGMEGKATKK